MARDEQIAAVPTLSLSGCHTPLRRLIGDLFGPEQSALRTGPESCWSDSWRNAGEWTFTKQLFLMSSARIQ